jgi:hypothetical protein
MSARQGHVVTTDTTGSQATRGARVAKFYVHLINQVSTAIEVEAETAEEAMEAVYDSPDMPGGITVGAYGQNSVDDGGWEAYSVSDESGETVYERDA